MEVCFKMSNNFYTECLNELQARDNWSEAYLPVLSQYVFKMEEADRLMKEIKGESVIVERTNTKDRKNVESSPKWRMFLELTRAAAALAKDLQLNPASAPAKVSKKAKGFDLETRVAV